MFLDIKTGSNTNEGVKDFKILIEILLLTKKSFLIASLSSLILSAFGQLRIFVATLQVDVLDGRRHRPGGRRERETRFDISG